MSNPAGILPTGSCILVRTFEVEEKTASGIVLHTEGQRRREEMGQTEGVVVALGLTAYADQPAPWCSVGDAVVFTRYAGLERKGQDGAMYRLINDLDVKGVLERNENA